MICTRCRLQAARHRVEHGSTDTGARVCCECMDEVMLLLAAHLVSEGKADEARDGLASFEREHAAECGPLVP